MLEDTMPDDKLSMLDDQIKQILSRFESRSKNFENSFKILLLFSILFLFIIQIPYLSIQVKKENINNEIKSVLSHVASDSIDAQYFKNVQSGINNLQRAIKRSPEELREFVMREINSSQNQNFTPNQQQQAIESVSNKDNLNKLVENELEKHFQDYKKILINEIIQPLDSLGEKDLTKFISDLDTLQNIFYSNYNENPDFWHTYAGKEDFFFAFDRNVNSYFSQFIEKLEKGKNDVTERLKRENHSKDSLINVVEKQKDIEQQITARMEQIEFPFGKIPIGLSESIAVFPLLITVGFLFLLSLLRETIKLRKNLHSLYLQKDPERQVFTDTQISLIAPLLIDPLLPVKSQRIKVILITLPLIIFITAVCIAIYTWTLPGAVIITASDTWWIYTILYLLSLILCIINFNKLFADLDMKEI